MLFNPNLPRLGRVGGEGSKDSVPPRGASGSYIPQKVIENAWETNPPPFRDSPRPSVAQRAGLRYQARVEEWLAGCDLRGRLVPGPWWAYSECGGPRRYCQPDFVVLLEGGSEAIVIEAKIAWTPAAYWQLEFLYRPVFARIAPSLSISTICITRSYDPAIPAPRAVSFCETISEAVSGQFNLLLLK